LATKTIFILVYNRPSKVRRCLAALRQAYGIENFQLLVVRQEGHDEVRRIIDDIDWIDVTHEVVQAKPEWKGDGEKAINYNIYHGLEIAFDDLNSTWVAVIEDDALIGYDFLRFCGEMITTYGGDREFVGVNGFSRKPFEQAHLFDYGKFRFHVGYGWAITRNSWRHWFKPVWTGSENGSWDVYLLPFLRKGYVVMPHCSRSYNIGWGSDAIHCSQDSNHPWYAWMRRSWVGDRPFRLQEYAFDPKLRRVWRGDCVRIAPFNSVAIAAYDAIVWVRYHPGLRRIAVKAPLAWVYKLLRIETRK